MSERLRNPKVDAFLARQDTWRAEFEALRAMLGDFDLSEEFKWGQPCYAFNGQNVVLMHGFKDYCALLFMKGALIDDPAGLLVQQTQNVQSARQIRFTSADQIARQSNAIRACIQSAIEVEKAGLKVVRKTTAEFDRPEEFEAALNANPELKKAFEALTPGRQRAYLLHFAAAKQAKTREARIAKATPDILAGKGLSD